MYHMGINVTVMKVMYVTLPNLPHISVTCCNIVYANVLVASSVTHHLFGIKRSRKHLGSNANGTLCVLMINYTHKGFPQGVIGILFSNIINFLVILLSCCAVIRTYVRSLFIYCY